MEYNPLLIVRAKSGDVPAFAQLYEFYYKDLYRFALYVLKNPHDAEDMVSETVTDAFHQLSSLRNEESFKAWIFRILTNKCKMKLKSYLNRTVPLPEDLPCSLPDLSGQADIRDAFFALENVDRLILSLNLFAGYSSKEIGALLGMKDSTVRSRQKRALKKMKKTSFRLNADNSDAPTD